MLKGSKNCQWTECWVDVWCGSECRVVGLWVDLTSRYFSDRVSNFKQIGKYYGRFILQGKGGPRLKTCQKMFRSSSSYKCINFFTLLNIWPKLNIILCLQVLRSWCCNVYFLWDFSLSLPSPGKWLLWGIGNSVFSEPWMLERAPAYVHYTVM
jgi:hypothetical protein